MSSDGYVVTGAGGFIGFHLANALAADGENVVGIDRQYPDRNGALGRPKFTAVIGDFRDGELMKRVLDGASVLFHLASAHLQVNLPQSEYWSINVHSLPDLLERARSAGVRRCVHTSSVGVYGDVGSTPASERAHPAPQSIYGETKREGEHAVRDFARANDYEVVILRPAWVYGPGCPRTIKILRALRKRRFLMIGSGRNYRHPLFIDDMIQAFGLAAEHPKAPGEIFNIAGEHAITTHELIEEFCTTFDLPRPPVRVPYALGASIVVCAESMCGLIGREPPISRRTLEFFNTNNTFDISRARDVLGFSPCYSLTEGLIETRRRMEMEGKNNACAA